MKNFQGFTLAEVLITLVIIGITSAKIFLGKGLRPWQSIVYSFIKNSCNYLINTIIRTYYSFIRYARHKRAFTARLLALTVTHLARLLFPFR